MRKKMFKWLKRLFVANIRKGSRVKVKGPSTIYFFGVVTKKKGDIFWVETDSGVLLVVNKSKISKEGKKKARHKFK